MNDFINGEWRPATDITEDGVISGTHNGSVNVLKGTLRIDGTLNGSLSIRRGAETYISGRQSGSVNLMSGAKAVVTGEISGSINVDDGALLIIEDGGKAAGSLMNRGFVTVRGVFGGAQSGPGRMTLEGQGYIKQPIIRDGISYYEW